MNDKRMMRFNIVRGACAILISLAVGMVFIFLSFLFNGATKMNVGASLMSTMEAMQYMLVRPLFKANGSFNTTSMFQILAAMIPTIFTGLATCVMFSANQFNLAGEGCVMVGGFVAVLVGIYWPMPYVIHPIVCVLVAAAVTGLIMLIPALLKVKLGASEMVTSLMLNYIMQFVVLHFLNYSFADRSKGSTQTAPVLATADIAEIIPNGSKFTWGFVIAIIFTILIWYFMYRTKWGYTIRMIGINQSFAKYSGMKVGGTIVLSQIIGGILSGMGGGIEVLGRYQTFLWKELPGYGWNGVTLAILAKNNPIFIPFAAFFIAYLNKGCNLMATYCDVPTEMIDIIQAAIFMFFAAEQFMAKYRQKVVVRNAKLDLAKADAAKTVAEGKAA